MAKGSAALTGRVGFTAIGAVKTATCAGVVFRARLIAVTGEVVIYSSNCSRRFQEGSPAFE